MTTASSAPKTPTILIIDDDEEIRYSLGRVLGTRQYHIVEAGSGEEGIAMAKKSTPDLVFLDIRMGGMSGIETLQHLRALNPQQLVVLMTAFGTAQTAIEAMKFGAFDYVMKPFDADRVLAIAENALKTAESAVATLVAGKPDVANLIAAQGTAAGYYLRANGNVPTLNPWPSSGTVEVSTPIEGKTATAHYLVIYEGRAPAFGERLPSTRSLRSRFTLIAQAGGLKPETNVVLSVSREY